MDFIQVMQAVELAKDIANKNICCKYSKFTVGAVLVTKSGKMYSGCNIENHGIQSICAERVAFCKALSEQEKDFKFIVSVSKNVGDNVFQKTLPCGYCRQFIKNYVDDDFKILAIEDGNEELFEYTINDLLPEGFDF